MLKPLEHLSAASKLYPNAWSQVEELVLGKGKDLPDWPDWCFIPMAGWYSIVSSATGEYHLPPHLIADVSRLSAIGTWRYSQGIYRFDPELLTALCQTELTGDIPVQVLYRLPEYCVYIETPDMDWFGSPLYGFWCHLERDINTGRDELRLLLDTEAALVPVPLHIGQWSLKEAVARADAETSRVSGVPSALLEKVLKSSLRIKSIQPLLSMILYLCSDEPEVQDERNPESKASKPSMTKTRNGFRLFPPSGCRIWQVGKEIGVKLRQKAPVGERETSGGTVRPHIRRPHWHGYWVGPKDKEQTFVYKWVAAILVGKSDGRGENSGSSASS